MASAFKIITPEEHVAQETGKLLANHLSFLAEMRRKLDALPDEVPVTNDENNTIQHNCHSSSKPTSK